MTCMQLKTQDGPKGKEDEPSWEMPWGAATEEHPCNGRAGLWAWASLA